jgi:Domain of unknown function (DUF6362)
MDNWTVEMVEERLAEAAAVMRRLPPVRVPGYFNTWPRVLMQFADLVGQDPPRLRLPPPSAAAISRMEEALGWLHWLEPLDTKIVWLRSSGDRWKGICFKLGLSRSAAHRHWQYALSVIALRLNGRRVSGKRSLGFVIARAQAQEL